MKRLKWNTSLAQRYAGSAAGESVTYGPGYPASGDVEPNVVAQWLFSESSGDIVDEVSGITLTQNETDTSYAYNQTISSGSYAPLSPGIMGDTNPSSIPRFDKASGTSSLDVASGSNVTVEAYFTIASFVANEFIGFFCMDPGSEAAGLMAFYLATGANEAAARLVIYVRSDDGTIHYNELAPNSGLFGSSDPVKLRFVINKSSTSEIIQDGTSLGTASATGLSGKAITNNSARIGGIWSSLGRMRGVTFYAVRVSHNATNNSGGPNGG